MKKRSARGGWYDVPSGDEVDRYIAYFHTRYPESEGDNWYWTYWDKPTGKTLNFWVGGGYAPWDASRFGSPFTIDASEHLNLSKYDQYYQRRFPWRRWQFCSAERLAARNGLQCKEIRQ